MMARKGILTAGNDGTQKKTDRETAGRTNKETPPDPASKRVPARRGAVGALQSSLTRLQENAVQEIDPGLIEDAGFEDRLGQDSAAFAQLKESLSTYGQQVPVLLRPHATRQGRYEIVYGRRRLKALRELRMPVKAMVRQLDDHALVMAQGQENTSRQDLSFIEKASFAAQLQDAGYDRATIAAALSTDQPMLSRMLRVGAAFDLAFLRKIGSAPGIGRDRWLALAKLFEDQAAKSRAGIFTRRPEFCGLDSDARFEAVFERASQKPEPAPARKAPARAQPLRAPDGKVLAEIRANTGGVTLRVPARESGGFDRWLHDQAETIINDLHARWQNERAED